MAIKFSGRFFVLLLALHILVVAVVYVTALPLGARSAILLMILLSLFYYLVRDVFLLLPDSWCEISLDQGGVAVVTRDGSKLFGQFVDETTASSYLVVLRVKLEGRHLPASRVIFPDALGAGAFREFCVRLRFA